MRKQTNCVRLVGKNSRAPHQNSAGSGGLRRAPRAKTSLGVRVRAGSGRFCCKGTALDLPTKVQAASEGPSRFRRVLTDSGARIRHFDPTNQRAPIRRAQAASEGSGGFRWIWWRIRAGGHRRSNLKGVGDRLQGCRAAVGGWLGQRQGSATFRGLLAGTTRGSCQRMVMAMRGSGPIFRSKLLRRLASRLAIVASKLLLYKLGIQSNALYVWFIVVASLLPWRTHASQ